MNLPTSFISSTRNLLGLEESDLLIEALSGVAPVSIRINQNKVTRYQVPLEESDREDVAWCKSGYYLPNRLTFTFDPLFHGGAYYVQEASSMFLSQILEQYIDKSNPLMALDLCAAPGGKTTLLRSLLPQESLLVANEIVGKRAQILSENLIKWGHPDVVVTNNEASDFGQIPHLFDVILADVPCSGEGMFRKDEVAIEEWSPENVEVCWKRQREIVQSIWDSLKPGGLFVYSTCTFNSKENEENVQWMIDHLGAESLPVDYASDWHITAALGGFHQHSYRFLPHKTKGEGLFMAALRKPADAAVIPIQYPKQKKKRKITAQEAINENLFKQAREWVCLGDSYELIIEDEYCFAFPKYYLSLLALLKLEKFHIIHAGTPVAVLKGRSCLPHAALAMSNLFNERAFSSVELSYEQAITYLRKEAVALSATTSKGFVCVRYKSLPLGFVKHLGNRSNNLYPSHWRIRSGYMPNEVRTL